MQIKAENLVVGYGDNIVIKDFSIDINNGEIVSIIGPNGCGKSTLINAITGLLKIRSGTLTLDSKSYEEFGKKELAREIATLSQMHEAPVDFLVKELVSYGRIPYSGFFGTNTKEDQNIIDWAMRKTKVKHLENKCINQISGGQLQRVWLSTILAQQPNILFLDEPTTYLDIAHQLEMMKIIRELKEKDNKGIVMVLHDISQAVEISDKIVIIHEGNKLAEGNPIEVVTSDTMKKVYNVNCDLIHTHCREKPIVAFRENDEEIK